jgi:hypothetical protein
MNENTAASSYASLNELSRRLRRTFTEGDADASAAQQALEEASLFIDSLLMAAGKTGESVKSENLKLVCLNLVQRVMEKTDAGLPDGAVGGSHARVDVSESITFPTASGPAHTFNLTWQDRLLLGITASFGTLYMEGVGL